jgi:hypothetical protein
LQRIIREWALREYAIPGSRRRLIGEKTIEAWYYAWRRDGIEGLVPKPRNDRGVSKLPQAVQEAVLAAKRENPRRSIRQLRHLCVFHAIRPCIPRGFGHRFQRYSAGRSERSDAGFWRLLSVGFRRQWFCGFRFLIGCPFPWV